MFFCRLPLRFPLAHSTKVAVVAPTSTEVGSANSYFLLKVLVEECHANVEAKDEDGRTPLMHASLQGHLTTVKYLVEEGHANVEAKNNDGYTALRWAKGQGKSDVVAYLRSKGATE